MSEAKIKQPDLEWLDGQPYSGRFGDVYFSRASGLQETLYVFLHQNQLQQRFSDLQRPHFTIAETGFGTALNFLCAWRLWEECAPEQARLHFVSAELYPLSHQELSQALGLWPELASLAARLLEQYRNLIPGFNRLNFGKVELTLLIGDAANLLPQVTGVVDAWFLDGYSPAKNPDMWDEKLLRQIARLSYSATTFATFTSAAAVRRGLSEVGFDVEKIKGFASKREMLRGRFNGSATLPLLADRTAVVIGGGIAGTSTAYSLAQRGFKVTLVERHAHLAAEASGNAQAVIYPRLSGHDIALSRIAIAGFLHTISLLKRLLPQGQDWRQCGLLQLAFNSREAKRCEEILARGLPLVDEVSAEQASVIAGIALSDGGLYFAEGGWLHPPAFCRALVAHENIRTMTSSEALHLQQHMGHWQVSGASGLIAEASVVVVAAANDCMQFVPHLPLQPVRGQITLMPATFPSNGLKAVVCTEGYLAPARDGLHSLGATFSADDTALDVRDSDHAHNLAMLRQMSPELQPDTAKLTGRSALRCSTPDYLPLAGMMLDPVQMHGVPAHLATASGLPWLHGLYVNTGHGSKGMVTAPLCGEIIAAAIDHEVMPVDHGLLRALDPNRFLLRALGLKKLTGACFD
ncbi:MAG TPA: bifunctional tRNA (5-methylaminomethyl-2-thiouridine)(34)-methyltransferase MnmD/FAD-dependent 5-carboxymethylaminomethyl-2-thiouridine(34) oxidoreductase MnmC [Methylophilaceae bacterium]